MAFANGRWGGAGDSCSNSDRIGHQSLRPRGGGGRNSRSVAPYVSWPPRSVSVHGSKRPTWGAGPGYKLGTNWGSPVGAIHIGQIRAVQLALSCHLMTTRLRLWAEQNPLMCVLKEHVEL